MKRAASILLIISGLLATWSVFLYYCIAVYFVIRTPGRLMIMNKYMPAADKGVLVAIVLLYLPLHFLFSWLIVRSGKLEGKWFKIAATIPLAGVIFFEVLNILR